MKNCPRCGCDFNQCYEQRIVVSQLRVCIVCGNCGCFVYVRIDNLGRLKIIRED